MNPQSTTAQDLPGIRTRGGKPQPVEVLEAPNALLRISTVVVLTGLSTSTIQRKLAAGQFPKPVKIGSRCTRWPAAAVRQWINDQAALAQ